MPPLRLTRFLALTVLIALSACGGSDTFISFAGKSAGQLEFCISAKPNCAAPGATLSAFEVDDIDPTSGQASVMWRIESPTKGTVYDSLDQIVYGVVPTGWTVRAPARALVSGRHYRVNSKLSFSVTPNGLFLSEGVSPGSTH